MFDKSIILNHSSKLTKQEKVVGQFIADKGFDLINMSITDIVKNTNTSLATVNRTISKIGYTGLKYYKMFLFSLLKSNPNYTDELDFQKKHLLPSIENTYSSVDEQKVVDVVNEINKNKESITFLCEGFSYHIGKIFSSKLNKIGFNSIIFDEQIYNGAFKSKLIIIISVNMNNESMHKKIKMIKNINPNAIFVLITTNAILKNNYDFEYVLAGSLIENFRMNSKELPSDSLVILLIITNLIFDKIYEKNKKDYSEIIEKIKW